MTDYMITGLAKARAAIATDIAETQERLRKLASDLESIDATLRIVAPDFKVESAGPIFRPPSDWSKRGEMSRVILDILRIARNPMIAREIAAQMIVERGRRHTRWPSAALRRSEGWRRKASPTGKKARPVSGNCGRLCVS